MKLYSNRLTNGQNAALAKFEQVTGIEPFGIEDFEAGRMTAYELWQTNVNWLQGVWATVQNIDFPVPYEEVIGGNS